MPTVSVITPCYKAEKFIGRTIESVQRQTFFDWEQIVVDDGSPDNSAAVVKTYLDQEPRLTLLRQANGGVENARNNGFAACSAESKYLLFLDADDCLEPHALETLVNYLKTHPEVSLVYCSLCRIDAEDRFLDEVTPVEVAMRFVPTRFGVRRLSEDEAETPLESIAAYFQAIPSCCFFHRSVYEQTRGWDESLRGYIIEDKDMLLQCSLIAPVHFLPQPLLRYRQHTTNISLRGSDQNRLERKWRQGEYLTAEQARRVKRAFNFDHLLTSYLQFYGGLEEVRQHHYGNGLQLSLQSAKKIGKYFLNLLS